MLLITERVAERLVAMDEAIDVVEESSFNEFQRQRELRVEGAVPR